MARTKLKWIPFFSIALLFLAPMGYFFANPRMEISLDVKGSMIVESVVEMHFKIVPFQDIDRIELILSSECFHEPKLGENLSLSDQENNNFRLLPFKRTKDLSRTKQSFQLQRIKSGQKLKEVYLVYKSPLPEAALTYPISLKLYQGGRLKTSETFNIDIKPGPTVHILCDWIESHKAPKIKCLGLDQKGNQTNGRLELKGSFSPVNSYKSHSFVDELILLPEQPIKPYSRFHYLFEGKSFLSSALPSPSRPIFFGDLHTHSAYSDSRVPAYPEDLVLYARDSSLLDFVAITDHAEGVFGNPLTREEFQETASTLAKLNAPGKFTTFLGFEWTSTFYNESSPHGHRTVIYPNLNGLPFRSDQELTDTPLKLYNQTGKVFSFPHHTMISWGSFTFSQPAIEKFEKGIEIYSSHGTSEKLTENGRMKNQIAEGSIQNGIKNRYPFRILASSDTHGAHPGLNNWNGIVPGMLDGGGLAAVFSLKNTRENIFEALYNQKFYGTSGTRILLEPASWKNLFPIKIHGTNQLQMAEIIEFFDQRKPQTITYALENLETTLNHSVNENAFAYYVRITQVDQEQAWIGPVYTKVIRD